MAKKNVHHQLLVAARGFIQEKGYNAFSYRDLAEKVGVKTASIHYYFPTKADLGKAVVEYHLNDLSTHLEILIADVQHSCFKKLSLFFDNIFESTYRSNQKMCLGGMLASDVLTLPEMIQKEIRIFFNRIEEWLIRLLEQGIKTKEFRTIKEIKKEVIILLSLLEGGLLLARLYQDENRLAVIKEEILLRLTQP